MKNENYFYPINSDLQRIGSKCMRIIAEQAGAYIVARVIIESAMNEVADRPELDAVEFHLDSEMESLACSPHRHTFEDGSILTVFNGYEVVETDNRRRETLVCQVQAHFYECGGGIWPRITVEWRDDLDKYKSEI